MIDSQVSVGTDRYLDLTTQRTGNTSTPTSLSDYHIFIITIIIIIFIIIINIIIIFIFNIIIVVVIN